MRSLVSSNRFRCLSHVAVLGLLAGITAGCSSDFTRFDRNLYAALPKSANQQNTYPGDIDPTTTASIGARTPKPLSSVVTPRAPSDDGNYSPDFGRNSHPGTDEVKRARPGAGARSDVISKPLPLPTAKPPAAKIDPVSTGSINKVNEPVARDIATDPSRDSAGWSRAGGTQITLRSGETLYNVSKRYGVPVKAIMGANNITDANAVRAGQRIVIPTYVYSQKAPVSAPDADPNTRAARASAGLEGQADPSRVILPTKRPMQTATLDQSTTERSDGFKPRYRPKPRAKEETNESVPDYSIVTGSVSKSGTVAMDGIYTVKSGDTLSKIASRSGVKVRDLMRANGLENSNIRVGQSLRIPDGSQAYGPKASAKQVSSRVDPIDVGSTRKKPETPRQYVKPTVDKTVTNSVDTKAPKRTGIDQFRWPVKGRIVSKFGQSGNDGIDISVPEGTSVKAAENGVVIYSGNELQEFGNLILVRHADGFVTAYAHNKSNAVSKGQNVSRGQVIARSGMTGKATSPMLHFEVRKNSKPVNPVKYLGG